MIGFCMKKIIALDADGVLLDYHAAYRVAWFNAFGVLPAIKDANAYWPIDRWDVRNLEGAALTHFRSQFDQEFWSTIPAIDVAVEACRSLVEHGYELVCVSAIESEYEAARLSNFKIHGFPIDRVIATSAQVQSESPKAKVLRALNPVAFVDDYAPYFAGVDNRIHKALVLRERNGSPNFGGNLALANSTHEDLWQFANLWIKRNSTSR